MAWTTPPTWTSGQTITSAFLNALRDNLLETVPAKATTGSWARIYVSSGTNQISERQIKDDAVDASESTSSVTFTDVATTGPSTFMTTGVFALVFSNADLSNTTSGGGSRTGVDVSGATTSGSDDKRGLRAEQTSGYNFRGGASVLLALTAGSNTFKMVYRVNAGTGSFAQRRLVVMGL